MLSLPYFIRKATRAAISTKTMHAAASKPIRRPRLLLLGVAGGISGVVCCSLKGGGGAVGVTATGAISGR